MNIFKIKKKQKKDSLALEKMLEKLDQCIEIQERNIQTLERINEIITR